MSQTHLTDQRFTDLDLPPALLQGIADAGFEFLTPIQADVLPPLLSQQDVAGQAQTGTGKTAAFLIAMFNRLQRTSTEDVRTGPRALILAPTRELAIQIFKDAEVLGAHLDYRLVLAYGGTGYDSQRRQISQGVDVLIGTPGRIIDYYKQGIFKLDHIEVMILDEADRMFDLGFIRDIRYLLRRMPEPGQRLNMLFSATLTLRVTELAYEHMNNPRTIKIESEYLTVDSVEERVYFPANDEKIPLLIGLLRRIDPTRTLVFVNTKHMAETLQRWLAGNGYDSAVLSGDVPQKQRESLLQRFKEGDLPLLIATDVAARGLHIPAVSHVINFDLPQDAEDYVHRVGRTARAGATGDAISFACETHAFSLADIEEYTGRKIPTAPLDRETLVEPLPPAPAEGRRQRNAGGGRGSKDADKRSRGARSGGDARRRKERPARAADVEPEKKPGRARPADGPAERDVGAADKTQPLPEAKQPAAESEVGSRPIPSRRRAAPRRREVPAVG